MKLGPRNFNFSSFNSDAVPRLKMPLFWQAYDESHTSLYTWGNEGSFYALSDVGRWCRYIHLVSNGQIIETYELCQKFILSEEDLCEIRDRMLKSILKGLSKEGHPTAAVRCWQTFVQDFPTGDENGFYMALDLGGTNFRVLSLELKGKGQAVKMTKETYELPSEMKSGPGEQLFDYVAECVADFFSKHAGHTAKRVSNIPLGFTFSFPLRQESLHSGFLIKWTKAFEASGVVGEDVVQLLREAILKKNLEVQLEPIVICNDTTGTLMSTALTYDNVRVGLIIGTGTNACYVERIENIENFRGDAKKPFMVINTEWGNFGADGSIDDYLTEYDKILISKSSHGRNQIFEKCISGRYIGEIMRLVLVRLVHEKILFDGVNVGRLDKEYGFGSEHLTEIENDPPEGPYENTKKVLKEMDIEHFSDQDLVDIRFVSEKISRRAACLTSAGIACVLNKMEVSPVTVAIDGTLYRKHPTFKDIMNEATKCLVDPQIQFSYVLSEDGSGRGAALIAAVTSSQSSN